MRLYNCWFVLILSYFYYILISLLGDDFALINSVEAVEDSPKSGYDSLNKYTDKLDSFIFIGITCGLSGNFY